MTAVRCPPVGTLNLSFCRTGYSRWRTAGRTLCVSHKKTEWADPLGWDKINAHCSFGRLLLNDPKGRDSCHFAEARKAISGYSGGESRRTLPQRAPEEAPVHGGLDIAPPHPPLEGECDRREAHVVSRGRGAAEITIVILPLV